MKRRNEQLDDKMQRWGDLYIENMGSEPSQRLPYMIWGTTAGAPPVKYGRSRLHGSGVRKTKVTQTLDKRHGRRS